MMKQYRKKKNGISYIVTFMLIVTMLAGMFPFTMLAEDNESCSHQHDVTCGYSAGSDCTYAHTHDTLCGYDSETESGCTDAHNHDESCGYAAAVACGHLHDETCAKQDEPNVCEHNNDPETCDDCNKSNVITPYGIFPLASIDGVDIDDLSLSYSTSSILENVPVLNINADFGDDTADRKIVITVANGLRVTGAPGFNGSLDFDASLLPASLQDVVESASFTRNATPIAGCRPHGGTFEYVIKPSATSVKIENITLTFDLAMLAGVQATFANAVKVEKFESGANANNESAALEKITCTNSFSPLFFPTSTLTISADTEYVSRLQISSFESDLLTYNGYVRSFNLIEISFRTPKSLGVTGASVVNVSGGTSISAGEIQSTVTDAPGYETTHDLVKITLTNADMTKPYFNIVGRTAADIPAGNYKLFEDFAVSATAVFGGATSNFKIDGSNTNIIISGDSDNKLVFHDLFDSDIADGQFDKQYGLLGLGGFAIENPFDVDITNKRIQFDFDITSTGAIGVKAVTVPTGPAGAKNIQVTTNLRAAFSVADIPSQGRVTPINLVGILAENEYIKSVSYDVDALEKGTYYDTQNGTNTPQFVVHSPDKQHVFYWGKLLKDLNPGEGYTSSVSVYDISGAPQANPESYREETVTVNASGQEPTAAYVSAKAVGNGQTLVGGMTHTIGVYSVEPINVSTRRITNSPTMNNSPTAYKGIYIYVREDYDLTADPDTFVAHWGSTTWRLSDNDGKVVYKRRDRTNPLGDGKDDVIHEFFLPDAIIGGFTDDLEQFPGVHFTIDVTADVLAETNTVPMQEIIMFRVAEGYTGWRKGQYQSTTDDFNVSGKGTGFLINSVHSENPTLSVQANPDVIVMSSADKNDGDWKNYVAGNESTYINVSDGDIIRYRSEIVNNTGETLSNGFSVIVPIAKEGAAVPQEFAESSFNWDLTLNVERELENYINQYNTNPLASYTVFYATDYLVSKEMSAGWKSWNDVKDNLSAVKAVLISSVGQIENGFTDSFYFPLSVEVSDPVSKAGEKNIFTSYIWRAFGAQGSSAGYTTSLPVALRLRTAALSGRVVLDADRNGYGVNDTGIKDVQVTAYKAGSRKSADIMGQTLTLADGSYSIKTLDPDIDVDLVFENPRIPSTPISSDDLHFTGNNITTADAHATGVIAQLTPNGTGYRSHNVTMVNPYKVQFNTNGATPEVTSQYAFAGEKVADPKAVLSRDGYNILNNASGHARWFTDNGTFSDEWNFASNTVNSDMTLHASVKGKQITIALGKDEILINTNENKTPSHGISYLGLNEAALLQYINSSVVSYYGNGNQYNITTDFATVRPTGGFQPGSEATPKEYVVRVTATDNFGSAYADVTIKVVDTTNPEIGSFTGSNAIEFRVGTAVDNSVLLEAVKAKINANHTLLTDDYAKLQHLLTKLSVSGWILPTRAQSASTMSIYRQSTLSETSEPTHCRFTLYTTAIR